MPNAFRSVRHIQIKCQMPSILFANLFETRGRDYLLLRKGKVDFKKKVTHPTKNLLLYAIHYTYQHDKATETLQSHQESIVSDSAHCPGFMYFSHSHDFLTKQSFPWTTQNLLMHNTPQSAYWKNIQTYRYARTITNCEIEYTSLYYNYLSCLSGHAQSQWTCRVRVSFLVKCTYVTIISLLIILNYLSKYFIMECDGVGTFNSAHKRLLSAMFFLLYKFIPPA